MMVIQNALSRQGCIFYCGLVVVGQACFLSLPSSGQTVAHLLTSVLLCSLHNLSLFWLLRLYLHRLLNEAQEHTAIAPSLSLTQAWTLH